MLSLNSHRNLECWFGIARVGLVLNDLNTKLAPAELAFILADSEARALIVDDSFVAVGSQLVAECASLRHFIHAGVDTADGLISFDALAAGRRHRWSMLAPTTWPGSSTPAARRVARRV